MASAAAEKTAAELRKEIEELHRQQREITERLRDPRGLRRAGAGPGPGPGPRPNDVARQRSLVRPAPEPDAPPAPKRRLLSAVVKVEGEEAKAEIAGADTAKEQDSATEAKAAPAGGTNSARPVFPLSNGRFRGDPNPQVRRNEHDLPPTEPLPRVLPKDEDPSLVKRNQRMFGQLLGTLQKFQQEDLKLSTTEAYMRRSDSLRRAEQKAREESEKLRQKEREQIAEKRRRDLTLRARVAAKAEEKKLELLFINWAEHHKKLCNFQRTKAEPRIYYMPARPLVDDAAIVEQRKEQAFLEWKSSRRAELSDYQRQIGEQYVANAELELQRWQNARNARRANNLVNLQETMDKELETHRLEHGPKTRRILGSNDEEEDVEDIVAEDELMDEVLEVQERIVGDATKLPEAGNGSPSPAEMQ